MKITEKNRRIERVGGRWVGGWLKGKVHFLDNTIVQVQS